MCHLDAVNLELFVLPKVRKGLVGPVVDPTKLWPTGHQRVHGTRARIHGAKHSICCGITVNYFYLSNKSLAIHQEVSFE